MMMTIRTTPANHMSVDELIVAVAFLEVLEAQILEDGQAVPESFKNELNACKRELAEKQRAAKQLRLKELRLRHQTLLSPSERRAQIEDEIAGLEADLGEGSKTSKKARARG